MFGDEQIFRLVILPALIFISRVCDVSIGTLRIMFVSRGRKAIAPILGFFEVLIWLLAITQIMQQLDNVLTYIAYAGGFAAGNLLGIHIEGKLAMGIYIVRAILTGEECTLMKCLKEKGFGYTTIDGIGSHGPVKMIYIIIRRKDLYKVVETIKQCNSNAFYSIEDARSTYMGIFPEYKAGAGKGHFFRNLNLKKKTARTLRKGK